MPDPLRNRGLLTREDRQHVAGNSDVADEDGREYDLRYNVRQRLAAIRTELELLREHGRDELADEIVEELARITVDEGAIQTRLVEIEQLRDE